jgi:protein gp37
MGDKTKIEWADATWNPVIGCSKVSAGCENCYAERVAGRLANIPATHDAYSKVVWWMHNTDGSGFFQWNSIIAFNKAVLDKPLKWKKPRRIFVCSMGDLFHESVPNEWLDRVFETMRMSATGIYSRDHVYMILTKRPGRMAAYLKRLKANKGPDFTRWPLHFVWLGVTVENQDQDWRIKELLKIPAAVRFVSVEPMLGPVDLAGDEGGHNFFPFENEQGTITPGLDWVICGGESGPGSRPMQSDWARDLRDQCEVAGVPFFFKKHGDWWCEQFGASPKYRENQELDGATWDQFPEARR